MAWCPQHRDQAPAADGPPHTDRTPKNARAKAQEDWRPRFLAAFEEHVVVTEACRVAGVGRRTVYDERARNETFAEDWAAVEERTTQRLEREAFRRAVDGVAEPVFHQGEVVGAVRKFSDTLLIFMLKARRPNMYRERVEHTGAGGGPLEHRMRVDLRGLTDEQLEALEAIQPDDTAGTKQA